jgi:hypothetical protein
MSKTSETPAEGWKSTLASLRSGLSEVRIRRRVLLSGLSGLVLFGGITASVLGDPKVTTDLDPAVVDALKFADNQDILLILAVDQAGNVQQFCGFYKGKPCQSTAYEEVPNPIKEIFGYITVSNPKVCWKTSGGDKECVTYD